MFDPFRLLAPTVTRIAVSALVGLGVSAAVQAQDTPKRGGTLVVVRAEVELMVTAGDIPEQITVDLSGRQIGESIHINDVALPDGVKPTIDRNFVIANIAAPSGLVSAEAAEDAEAGDTAE